MVCPTIDHFKVIYQRLSKLLTTQVVIVQEDSNLIISFMQKRFSPIEKHMS